MKISHIKIKLNELIYNYMQLSTKAMELHIKFYNLTLKIFYALTHHQT